MKKYLVVLHPVRIFFSKGQHMTLAGMVTNICQQMVQEGSIGFGRPPVPIMTVGTLNVNDVTAVVEFCTTSSGIGTS
jgi:hypothetical protein